MVVVAMRTIVFISIDNVVALKAYRCNAATFCEGNDTGTHNPLVFWSVKPSQLSRSALSITMLTPLPGPS